MKKRTQRKTMSSVCFCGVHSLVSQTEPPTATGGALVTAFHLVQQPKH